MARRDSIALYKSPKGLLWRRLSEPSPTIRANDRQKPLDGRGTIPKAFRRYSFSALEDYRKDKRLEQKIPVSSDRIDVTPLHIRKQVEGLLHKNGFKDIERGKMNLLRRCSLSSDKDALPLLGDGVRRHSFGAGVLAATITRESKELHESNNRLSKTNGDVGQVHTADSFNNEDAASKEEDEEKKDEAGPAVDSGHIGARQLSESEAPINAMKTNAWENCNEQGYCRRSELRRTLPDGSVEVIKLPEAENIDDHLLLKRSLWKGRCRRDSVSKFRNRVVDALRSYVETDTEYWRRCRSLSIDDGSSNIPKCKYRLRENGLIESELANHARIDIDSIVSKLEDHDHHGISDQTTAEAATPDKAEVLHNLLKRRRKSSLFSEYDFDRKTLLQRSLSSFSDRNSRVDSPEQSRSQNLSFQRSFSRQDSRPEILSGSEACMAQHRSAWRRSSNEKRRWSQTPSEGFELIGTAELHGTPGYKGRLMLLTARTVRFHDEFNSTA